MNFNQSKFSVDRSILKITSLHEDDTDEYWLNKSVADRLEAIEITRQLVYGYGPVAPRLQRLLEVTRR